MSELQRLAPQGLPQFVRRYHFPGGRVRRMRVALRSEQDVSIEFRLLVRESIRELGVEPRRVKLTIRLTGVEEYRLQMRPSQPRIKIADARISQINSLIYVNLDAWGLEPGDTPQLHDFRASEVFAAGRELWWEETPVE